MNLYDYLARQYDGTVPRFMSMDPLAEKYYSISPYVYCANNPLKFIDPDGRTIRGTDGKPVKLIDGKWSSNTSSDIKRLGSVMLRSKTATKQLNYMLSHSKEISLSISPEAKKNTKGAYVLGRTRTKTTYKKGESKKESFEIVIYEGSAQKAEEYAKEENQPSDVKKFKGLSIDEIMGSATGHEAEHTTPENVKLQNSNDIQSSEKAEKKPYEIQWTIVKELLDNKK